MAGDNEVSLVQATLADAELIFSFMQQLWTQEHVERRACADDTAVRAGLNSLITHSDLGRLWLIKSGAGPVGYAAATFFHSLEFAGRCALIDEFFIEAEHRGQGIGKASLNWICQTVPKLDVRALFLEVSPANAAAQGLYRSAGFEERPYNFLVRSTF